MLIQFHKSKTIIDMGKIIELRPENEEEISGMKIKVISVFKDTYYKLVHGQSKVDNQHGIYIKDYKTFFLNYPLKYAFVPDNLLCEDRNSNYFVLPFGTIIELLDVPPHTNEPPVNTLPNDSQNIDPILNTPDNEPTTNH